MYFRHPSTLIVCGPTQSGKTTLVRDIIHRNVYDKNLKYVKWFYGIYQDWFLEEPSITFEKGLPSSFENCGELIVIDDLMNDLKENVSYLFTVGSHHHNISVILIMQNIFPRCKVMRDISLNSHYMILFRNRRDVNQLSCLARQAFPHNTSYFMDAYKKATEKPFGYLVVDFHPLTEEKLRLRESCFPDVDGIRWVYVPKI